MKTILKQISPEHVYYDFEDATGINEEELKYETIVITGNRDFSPMGDKQLIDVINNDYYDDDLTLEEHEDGSCDEVEIGYDYEKFAELKKLTGKEWEQTTFRGYSQSDWQDVYYAKDEVSADRLEELEAFYMGKVSEFRDDDNCHYHVPDDVVWDGKKAICDYLGLKEEDTEIYDEKGEEIE